MSFKVGNRIKVVFPHDGPIDILDLQLHNDDIIEIIGVLERSYKFKVNNGLDEYLLAKEVFDGLNYFELFTESNPSENTSMGGRRRKHRKTRHRKMKRSKTTKRKVRR